MEFSFALVRSRVHELNSDGFDGVGRWGGESAGVNGAEATVTEGRGEGVSGAAEEGVGETVGRVVEGEWSGAFFSAAVAEEGEEEKEEYGGCGGEERCKDVVVAVVWWCLWREV